MIPFIATLVYSFFYFIYLIVGLSQLTQTVHNAASWHQYVFIGSTGAAVWVILVIISSITYMLTEK